jgi:putative PEP-CTERM system TPR-repeat lipoprotein
MANLGMLSRACCVVCGMFIVVSAPLRAAVIGGEAVEQQGGVQELDIRRVNELIANKQFDKAMAEVELLEKRQPDNATVAILKGAVYLAKRDFANARKAFERASKANPKSVAALMNLAQLDLLEKNTKGAQQRFQAALAIDPSNADAMVGMADVAAAEQREADYRSWLERAVATGPSQLQARVLLGRYRLNKREFQPALKIAREARSLAPENPQVLDLLGSAQVAVGDSGAALNTYEHLVNLSPSDPQAYYKLAAVQATRQAWSPARLSLGKALQLKPDFLDAEILLSAIELETERYGESLRIARDVQRQYPKSSVGLTLEGDVLMGQKQYSQAQRFYERAFAIRKSGVIAIKLHKAQSAAGNDKEAQTRLLGWIRETPNDFAARRYLAMDYVKLGQVKPAIEQFEYMAKADPGNAAAANDLASLYQLDNDPRALPTAERAFELAPDRADVVDTLGWILFNKGDTNRGTQLIDKAAQLDPSNPAIGYHRAAALVKRGEKAQAVLELEKLLQKNAKFPERTLAEALLKQLKG